MADIVAGEGEAALGRVPEREGEIAEQALDRLVAPALERVQEDGGVGEAPALDQAQLRGERVAIVQPHVGDQDEATGAGLRAAVMRVFRQQPVKGAAEGDVAAGPRRVAMRGVNRLRAEHALARCRRIPGAEAPEAGDCRHFDLIPAGEREL